MRKYLFILMLVLAACSSSKKTNEEAAVEDISYPQSSSNSKNEVKSIPEPPKASTSKSDSNALEDAINSGSDEQIMKVATSVLAKNANDVPALNAMGVVAYKRGQLQGALLMFEKALKINSKYTPARNNKATVFIAQREFREAIKEYRKVLETDPNNAVAAANLGGLYIENKDYNKAFIALDIASRKFYRDPKIQTNYGIALAATGKYPEAKEAYLRAMDKSPGNKDIMFNYAVLLINHLKQYKEGLDLINKIKFLGPSPEVKVRINTLENVAKAGIK